MIKVIGWILITPLIILLIGGMAIFLYDLFTHWKMIMGVFIVVLVFISAYYGDKLINNK